MLISEALTSVNAGLNSASLQGNGSTFVINEVEVHYTWYNVPEADPLSPQMSEPAACINAKAIRGEVHPGHKTTLPSPELEVDRTDSSIWL